MKSDPSFPWISAAFGCHAPVLAFSDGNARRFMEGDSDAALPNISVARELVQGGVPSNVRIGAARTHGGSSYLYGFGNRRSLWQSPGASIVERFRLVLSTLASFSSGVQFRRSCLIDSVGLQRSLV